MRCVASPPVLLPACLPYCSSFWCVASWLQRVTIPQPAVFHRTITHLYLRHGISYVTCDLNWVAAAGRRRAAEHPATRSAHTTHVGTTVCLPDARISWLLPYYCQAGLQLLRALPRRHERLAAAFPQYRLPLLRDRAGVDTGMLTAHATARHVLKRICAFTMGRILHCERHHHVVPACELVLYMGRCY